jgi:hypothetical protein
MTPRMGLNELHLKILGFLAEALAGKDHRQCIEIALLYAPGNGFLDEPLRLWTRKESPELFDFGSLADLVFSILKIARDHTDSLGSPVAVRHFVRTTEFLCHRQVCSFRMPPNAVIQEDMPLVMCRRAGCGKIIEDFWKFCPTCGTKVLPQNRELILTPEAKEALGAAVGSFTTVVELVERVTKLKAARGPFVVPPRKLGRKPRAGFPPKL